MKTITIRSILRLAATAVRDCRPPAIARRPPGDRARRAGEERLDRSDRRSSSGDKVIQQGDGKRITEVIEAKILPHFNFARMTALAMGPNWRKATPEQQKALVEQFKTLLVRTYSTGLSSYRDQKIDFKPLRAQPERHRRPGEVGSEALRRRTGHDRLQHGEVGRLLEGVRRDRSVA